MRRALLVPAAAAFAALALALPVRAEDPPANAPKPPDTPLPAYENPASDCQVGETCLYQVRETKDKEGRRIKYFEEHVLARTADRALVETIETDATGAKRFRVVPERSGWPKISKDFPADPSGPGSKWKKDQQKDEIVYVGPANALRAVRCTLRVVEEPTNPNDPEGKKRDRQIWFSHDVAARGIAKMFPYYGFDAERRALSWDKKLSPEECAKLAGHYPTAEEAEKAEKGEPAAGMDEPGMDGAGMDDPSMGTRRRESAR